MTTCLLVFNFVFGVTQLLFSIAAIISGSVCLSHSCSISSAASGALLGAGIVGLINNVRMIFMYYVVGNSVGGYK